MNSGMLIILQKNWDPEPLTEGARGRELAFLSYMGGFLNLSPFLEDDSRVADHFFPTTASPDRVRVAVPSIRATLASLRVRSLPHLCVSPPCLLLLNACTYEVFFFLHHSCTSQKSFGAS